MFPRLAALGRTGLAAMRSAGQGLRMGWRQPLRQAWRVSPMAKRSARGIGERFGSGARRFVNNERQVFREGFANAKAGWRGENPLPGTLMKPDAVPPRGFRKGIAQAWSGAGGPVQRRLIGGAAGLGAYKFYRRRQARRQQVYF